jgi:hypothetical protein
VDDGPSEMKESVELTHGVRPTRTLAA